MKSLAGAPPLRKDTDFTYAAEILITKSELEDKNRRVFTLQQQVDETKTESEYQLRLKDNKYIEEGRIAKKKFNAELTEMKNVIQRMEADIVTGRIHNMFSQIFRVQIYEFFPPKCNLDLVTLLVSAKTVTKSHNVTESNDFML